MSISTDFSPRVGAIIPRMVRGKPERTWTSAEMGRKGGRARAKRLTAKERRAIATKASKAAATKRTEGAKSRTKRVT